MGRYAETLDLLPIAQRARAESLAALVRGLLDFAREPGFASERLAKILLWQDRLDEALENGHADESIFAVFVSQDRLQSWDRPALERFQAMMRSLALTGEEPESRHMSEALWILMLGELPGSSSLELLACLLRGEAVTSTTANIENELPAPLHRASRYSKLASRGSEPGVLRRAWIRLRSRF